MKIKNNILLIVILSLFTSCSPSKIDNSKNELFTWKTLPKNIFFQRKDIKKFKDNKNLTHYYEIVYITSANINWEQASHLAKDAGGYLLSITNEEEKAFINNLISNKSWNFLNWTENRMTYGKEKSDKNVYGFIIEYEKI